MDSNVLVRSLEPEPHSEVRTLWRQWLRDKVMLHAPALLHYEVVNALYRSQKAGEISADHVRRALDEALQRPIVLHEDEDLHTRAFELAVRYRLPAAYDAHYLALAEKLGVELWTADARLVKAVQDQVTWVRLVS